MLVHATGTSSLILSLLVDAGCSVTVSCDEDVGDVGVAELEELVIGPRTTKGTNSLTYTVACSVVSTSPLAVTSDFWRSS